MTDQLIHTFITPLVLIEVTDHYTVILFQLKIKEALHIQWECPSLNEQLKHLNLTLPL